MPTEQTDLGLRSRNFSLKINKLPTFSEITQAWHVQRLSLYCQVSSHTELQLQILFLTLDIEPTTPKFKGV